MSEHVRQQHKKGDPGVVEVQEGETLYSIAKAYLGKGADYDKLFPDNKEVLGTHTYVKAGTLLKVPGQPEPSAL